MPLSLWPEGAFMNERWHMFALRALTLVLLLCCSSRADDDPRARDLGIPFDGRPAAFNAITDVKGVEVGHATIISGEGKLHIGRGPVRTGVTAILPRGKRDATPVFAGWFSLNGNGEMTGTTWVEESGLLEGPILLTNTYSVGTVRDAALSWLALHAKPPKLRGYDDDFGALPVVAETWDGDLNDIRGFHVKQQHVFAALDWATAGRVAEGNVGGGTGMIAFDFKGGIGTASRRVRGPSQRLVLGVLAQCNFGVREQLRIAGVPVGKELPLD
jgi:D-aminopeptidase